MPQALRLTTDGIFALQTFFTVPKDTDHTHLWQQSIEYREKIVRRSVQKRWRVGEKETQKEKQVQSFLRYTQIYKKGEKMNMKYQFHSIKLRKIAYVLFFLD